MTTSPIVTFGFGSFSSANLVVTMGFTSAAVTEEITELTGYFHGASNLEAQAHVGDNITAYSTSHANLEGYRL